MIEMAPTVSTAIRQVATAAGAMNLTVNGQFEILNPPEVAFAFVILAPDKLEKFALLIGLARTCGIGESPTRHG
ncbi:MAG: hypothetical protein WDN06_12970 [Asticcacaulis sp.]